MKTPTLHQSIIIFLLFGLVHISAAGGQQHEPGLIQGLGNLSHPVTTANPLAQSFFNQGLTLVYAFNDEKAIQQFEQSAKLDPTLAMAHWGIALALGPDINIPMGPEQEKKAYDAIQKAKTLMETASESDRDYIMALEKRYSAKPDADRRALSVAYMKAMRELSQKYPDDPDAATLYAESIMLLSPWNYWTADGKPRENTMELLSALGSVLAAEPDHPGANHFFIHAIEASAHPEWGLASAIRLETLAPAAGHLVHMPAHIYMRIGDYAGAVRANQRALNADKQYIDNPHDSIYATVYPSHNFHFLAVAYSMQGRYAEARASAQAFEKHLTPEMARMMPMVEGMAATSLLIAVRFRKWDEILKSPEPDPAFRVTTALRHFARTTALAGKGRVGEAKAEFELFRNYRKTLPADAIVMKNSAGALLDIAQKMAQASIAVAEGVPSKALPLLKDAVALEDNLNYDEPSNWIIPMREVYGEALLLDRKYLDAEKIFREDLARHPRNGRSLFGLLQSLTAQKKTASLPYIRRQYEEAWKNADTVLIAPGK